MKLPTKVVLVFVLAVLALVVAAAMPPQAPQTPAIKPEIGQKLLAARLHFTETQLALERMQKQYAELQGEQKQAMADYQKAADEAYAEAKVDKAKFDIDGTPKFVPRPEPPAVKPVTEPEVKQ